MSREEKLEQMLGAPEISLLVRSVAESFKKSILEHTDEETAKIIICDVTDDLNKKFN